MPPVFLFDGVCCCAARPRPSCSEAPSTGGPGQRWRGGIKQPSNLQHKDSHIQHSSRQAAQYHWKQSPSQAASETRPHPSVAQGILDTCTPLGRIQSIPHESLSRTPTTALITNADSCSGISAASRHMDWALQLWQPRSSPSSQANEQASSIALVAANAYRTAGQSFLKLGTNVDSLSEDCTV